MLRVSVSIPMTPNRRQLSVPICTPQIRNACRNATNTLDGGTLNTGVLTINKTEIVTVHFPMRAIRRVHYPVVKHLHQNTHPVTGSETFIFWHNNLHGCQWLLVRFISTAHGTIGCFSSIFCTAVAAMAGVA